MKTIYLTEESTIGKPCIATIGFFDGVHLGHQFLIRQLAEEAMRKGMESTVVTFDCHPRQVLQPDFHPQMLNTFDERLRLLSMTGIDNCVILSFTPEMATMSARQFMQEILRNQLNVRRLHIGYDHRFGHNREEGFEDYVRYGREMGMEVVENLQYTIPASPSSVVGSLQVSSSQIRRYILNGEVEKAERCLGYPYFIRGRVVNGVREGRKLGYPTANIEVEDAGKLIPAQGVYAVNVRLGQEEILRPAMMNIGTRPTFGSNHQTLEVHILDFQDNLYGKLLTVGFLCRLRNERRFEDTEALKEQLQADALAVREVVERFNIKE